MTRIRSYTELKRIRSYEGRYEYLRIRANVGVPTFGFERYLNQRFYTSIQWRNVRNYVIARDYGRDLGIEGYEIYDRVIVHHMNPMAIGDVIDGDESILDPEFLISVALMTHNAIHFGDENLLIKTPVVRRPGDTKLW